MWPKEFRKNIVVRYVVLFCIIKFWKSRLNKTKNYHSSFSSAYSKTCIDADHHQMSVGSLTAGMRKQYMGRAGARVIIPPTQIKGIREQQKQQGTIFIQTGSKEPQHCEYKRVVLFFSQWRFWNLGGEEDHIWQWQTQADDSWTLLVGVGFHLYYTWTMKYVNNLSVLNFLKFSFQRHCISFLSLVRKILPTNVWI